MFFQNTKYSVRSFFRHKTNTRTTMKAIEINQVNKTYKASNRKQASVRAVKDVTLDIEEGEIFGLLGANGAGKTTLIKLMLGLASLDSGSILIEGYDVASNREKALVKVGAIVEEPTLFADFTGRENLRYFARMQNADISEEKLDSIIELVGLTDRIDSKFKTYSLGMRQRLGIAQAIMHSPEILILDEPTNGLDPSGIVEMRELFTSLKKQLGITIVISSHILSEMQQLCDRVAFMVGGEVKAVKTMEEVNYGVDKLKKYSIECSDEAKAIKLIRSQGLAIEREGGNLVVRASHAEIADTVRLLASNGIDVYGLVKLKRRLEDLYKEVSSAENPVKQEADANE